MSKHSALMFLFGCISVILFASDGYAQEFKQYNTGKPISIEANSLEVLQNEKKAIFTGSVVATQGDIHLKSNKMTVFYKGGGLPGGETTSTATAGSGISRIDVDGNVFLATPQESAKGDKGVYNVDQKTIRLVGGVVLTKGQNVLKGSALEYNLATGKSLLNGGVSGTTADGKPSGGGRVKALFVPEQGKK